MTRIRWVLKVSNLFEAILFNESQQILHPLQQQWCDLLSIPTSLTSTICHVIDLIITQVSSWFVRIHESLLGSFISASFFGFWIRMLICSLGGNLATILAMLLKIWLNLQHQIWYCVWEYDDGVLAAILLQNWGDFLVWEELFHLCKSGCWNENLTTLCQGEDSLTHWMDLGLQVWTMTMRKCRAVVAS